MEEEKNMVSSYVKSSSENACKKINELKNVCSAQAESKSRWMAIFRDNKIPYYQRLVTFLVEANALRYWDVYTTNNNVVVNRYRFTAQDLKPSDFYDVFNTIKKYNDKRADEQKRERVKNNNRGRTFSIANHGIRITQDENNKPKSLGSYPSTELIGELKKRGLKAWESLDDSELVDRLRERGYEVTARKVITKTIEL